MNKIYKRLRKVITKQKILLLILKIPEKIILKKIFKHIKNKENN